MPARRVARWAAVIVLVACAHAREEPGAAAAEFYHYMDNQGLSVTTVGVTAAQPLARRITLLVESLVDFIVVNRPADVHVDMSGQPTGHQHGGTDALTSASVTVTGGERLEKTRVEGIAGVRVAHGRGSLVASVRGSVEPDYQSISGQLRLTFEWFERSMTASVFTGYGYDAASPIEPPPGETELWPAANERWNVGVSIEQIVTPTLVVSGGLAGSRQAGTLSNPYRRALVRTSLFPEHLPTERVRVTGFASLAWYLGWDLALHVRLGLYADSWAVHAFIPECDLVKELGERGLLRLQYRFYLQGPASFYEPGYDELEAVRTGDLRLGQITNHVAAAELRWTVVGTREDFGALTLGLGYSVSFIDYPEVSRSVVAHVQNLLVSVTY